MYKDLLQFIRAQYNNKSEIHLHEPVFIGNEKKYLNECIDSTMVSSVGPFVEKMEQAVSRFTGSAYAVACVNGTAALHVALHYLGVDQNSEVITQSLTFAATANAISYTGAKIILVDVDADNFSLCPKSLKSFLDLNTYQDAQGRCINRSTGRVIRACVPMHTFGLSADIETIGKICQDFNLYVVEDAAEALGSYYQKKHLGTYGRLGVLSFNGNKVVTTGGGGMILCKTVEDFEKLKHLTTTARIKSEFDFAHDQLGFNYRMPNLNAALGLAQMESLEKILSFKRKISKNYGEFLKKNFPMLKFISEQSSSQSNYWLCAVQFPDEKEAKDFYRQAVAEKIFVRAPWVPMHQLPMYQCCQRTTVEQTEKIYKTVINLPSGYCA